MAVHARPHMAAPLSYKGYWAIDERTVSHCVSVNASILAAAPPKRDPVPESPTPPNGAFASSPTVCSLIWIFPDSTISDKFMAIPTSPKMPTDRPYSDVLTMSAASSMVENGITGATGPKISSTQAEFDVEIFDNTVGE